MVTSELRAPGSGFNQQLTHLTSAADLVLAVDYQFPSGMKCFVLAIACVY